MKIKEAVFHLWHDALIDKVVENMRYEYISPHKGITANDLIRRETGNEPVLNKSTLITENGQTYEECIEKIKAKQSNDTIILGKR
jgi:hypothetical protein